MLFPVLCLLSPCSQPRLIWKLNPGEYFEITIMFLLRFLWNFIDMFYHHFMVQVLQDYYRSHVDAAVGPPRPLITGETFQQLQDRLDSGIWNSFTHLTLLSQRRNVFTVEIGLVGFLSFRCLRVWYVALWKVQRPVYSTMFFLTVVELIWWLVFDTPCIQQTNVSHLCWTDTSMCGSSLTVHRRGTLYHPASMRGLISFQSVLSFRGLLKHIWPAYDCRSLLLCSICGLIFTEDSLLQVYVTTTSEATICTFVSSVMSLMSYVLVYVAVCLCRAICLHSQELNASLLPGALVYFKMNCEVFLFSHLLHTGIAESSRCLSQSWQGCPCLWKGWCLLSHTTFWLLMNLLLAWVLELFFFSFCLRPATLPLLQ